MLCKTRVGSKLVVTVFHLFRRGIKEQRHEDLRWLKITQVLATASILGLLWWQSGCKIEKKLEEQVL